MKIKKAAACFLAYAVCAFLAFPAYSADTQKGTVVDIIPAHSATGESAPSFNDDEATHPPLRITPDKSELVYLDQDAASIIVGNPMHTNVIADSPRTLVIIPRSPGATYFMVLNKDGQVIMQRHVIVASPKDGYVRVKRTCNKDVEGCRNTSVFYCPDMCHEIGSVAEEKSDSGSKSEDKTDDSEDNNADAEPTNEPAAEEGTTEE